MPILSDEQIAAIRGKRKRRPSQQLLARERARDAECRAIQLRQAADVFKHAIAAAGPPPPGVDATAWDPEQHKVQHITRPIAA
jgi:hypothetical protein